MLPSIRIRRLTKPLYVRARIAPSTRSVRQCTVSADAEVARTTSPLVRSCEFCTPPLKVRAFEIDQYGVVNNAVYVQYLQHARHELLEAKELEYHPDIPAYALSELTMKYRSPLRATETYIVTVSVQVFKRARVILKQRVIFLHDDGPEKDQEPTPEIGFSSFDHEVAVEGQATVVLLDTNYRPMKIPGFFSQSFNEYMDDEL